MIKGMDAVRDRAARQIIAHPDMGTDIEIVRKDTGEVVEVRGLFQSRRQPEPGQEGAPVRRMAQDYVLKLAPLSTVVPAVGDVFELEARQWAFCRKPYLSGMFLVCELADEGLIP